MRKLLLSFMMLVSGTTFLLGQPVITSQPTNQLVVDGGNTSLNFSVSGGGPIMYRWLFNGTNLPFTHVITTIAGTGANGGSLGDGGPAINAVLAGPAGVTVDQAGNIFVHSINRIRKIDAAGNISTVAGNGSALFYGDGGMATNAQLITEANVLNGIIVDGVGNIFISDTGSYRVRKVDTNGIINTIAGNGSAFFSGDGGAATNAGISPAGIAVDGFGNLFIADAMYNQRIRKVDTNGIITTVAGTNSAVFAGDGGAAIIAHLQRPEGVTVDALGNIFIADTLNNRIREVDTNGIIRTVAGSSSSWPLGDGGSAVAAALHNPSRAILDAFGNMYIADTGNSRIRKVDANGLISTVAGNNASGYSGDGMEATNSELYQPLDLVLDANGNLLIADNQNNRVRKVDLAGSPILQLNGITTNNAGSYQLVATSPSGSVTSSIVSLGVTYINAQPVDARAAYGSPVAFNVAVSGDAPFGYQWFTSSGRRAVAVPVVTSGYVQSVSFTTYGLGYAFTPKVQFIGGSGSGAGGKALVSAGMVVAITITNQGSGYAIAPPVIQIDPPLTVDSPLPGQTNAQLVLPAVSITDATNYYVVATGNYGSITSATVTLTTFLAPQNFTAKIAGTGLKMQLTGTPYYPYVLQFATNLTPPILWKSSYTNYADITGYWSVTIPNIAAQPGSFYRTVGL